MVVVVTVWPELAPAVVVVDDVGVVSCDEEEHDELDELEKEHEAVVELVNAPFIEEEDDGIVDEEFMETTDVSEDEDDWSQSQTGVESVSEEPDHDQLLEDAPVPGWQVVSKQRSRSEMVLVAGVKMIFAVISYTSPSERETW